MGYVVEARSIPACAGEPYAVAPLPPGLRVYPRVCGGTMSAAVHSRIIWGLSPRVRGNQAAWPQSPSRRRSIPACAGEPAVQIPDPYRTRVYPRVCGGTHDQPAVLGSAEGLSPRVRGNPMSVRHHTGGLRSIPACAGEPRTPAITTSTTTVYPRVCGGTDFALLETAAAIGLSPRVRGNRSARRPVSPWPGSIPACAGEPLIYAVPLPHEQVYPRVCGGTAGRHRDSWPWTGLSPRVRGNRSFTRYLYHTNRSIPACAGEPPACYVVCAMCRVYPRVCGGTGGGSVFDDGDPGLSPRVRGNHDLAVYEAGGWRSIPACAGEPQWARRAPGPLPVYPRVCGGTTGYGHVNFGQSGLSPRVRGNQEAGRVERALSGSIPACAGEPLNASMEYQIKEVYPRVCGGTELRRSWRTHRQGLSPRVRGNRLWPGLGPARRRSIPACAGEPSSLSPKAVLREVYPRVCGGTASTKSVR